MHRSDDIANLFSRFGASAEHYQEIEPSYEYADDRSAVLQAAPVPAFSTAIQPPRAQMAAPANALGALLAQGRQQRQHLDPLQPQPDAGPKGPSRARVVALLSGKGGVGRTTLTAGLACALERPNGRVLAIDLDPQNALALHLGLGPQQAGIVEADEGAANWQDYLRTGHARTQCLAYGNAREDQQRRLEQVLEQDSNWLARHLAQLDLKAGDTVLIDTPTGASCYLRQVLQVADALLIVTLADAASYNSLQRLDRLLASHRQGSRAPVCRYLINLLDDQRSFSLDMAEILRNQLGDQLLGTVHQDHQLGEALAYERNPLARGPSTRGCAEILQIGAALDQLLAHDTQEPISP